MKKILERIGNVLKQFGSGIAEGDIWVKLSALIMGAGYVGRGQVIKGILMTVVEAVFILYMVMIGAPYLAKFDTLGTVQFEKVFNIVTMKNEVNDYDHSFKILLFGVVSIVLIVAFVAIWFANIIKVRKLELLKKEGKHINTFKEDLRMMVNEKFHITLLALPVLGIIVFTIVPLIIMIAVAFTNYDQAHMPPSALFTWVGWRNFKSLFTTSTTVTFGYSFRKVIVWTFVWAFFATFTTYIGGILLAKFINDPKTKLPKLWRTLFVVTIAVPQFVSLLLVRNFFANSGIVNTICTNIGLTDFLKSIGLVKQSLTYIPFLTDPNWAKFMIIMINIWVGVPYQMLIATGVLMNIPGELVESAKIDGANPLQIFRNITMPYMLFVTGPSLITQFIANINNFNVIYLLTQDMYKTTDQMLANSNAKEVDLLVTWLFRLTSEQYNYKMASVIGCIVFIICAVFTLIAFTNMTKGDKEESFQ
jgi:arabinogalactan oligomer/maltooligosaccharide transport system permease protein